jgi:hypothetical protein
MPERRIRHVLPLAAAALSALAGAASAQLTERPGTTYDNPIDKPRDPTGFSIKTPRVRAVCTTDPDLPGGTAYLFFKDPWLGYQRGRELFQREMRVRDGVGGEAGKLDGPALQDGSTKMLVRDNVNSCATCHGTPYRDAGAGPVMAKNGGTGRKSPHLFGIGLQEMIGEQIRALALEMVDRNRDGWISKAEAAGKRCVIANIPGRLDGEQQWLDFGRFDDLDGDGRPDLDFAFNITFVDARGQRMVWATGLNDPGVAGYTIQVMTFMAAGLPVKQFPGLPTTLRAFTAQAADIHQGQQIFDDTLNTSGGVNGWAQVSLAGQRQFVTHASRDRGTRRREFVVSTKSLLDPAGKPVVLMNPEIVGPPGYREANRWAAAMHSAKAAKPAKQTFHLSVDDPDRDGYVSELSEGDSDLLEWYQLNHPAPARGRQTERTRRGETLFAQIGCTSCHTPDWHLYARDEKRGLAGDRRFFDLQVAYNDKTRRLEGRLIDLTTAVGDRRVPKYGEFTVRGVYSDFRYHDIGEKFYQTQFDGSVIKRWRTKPLWGGGNAGPYGHDGASMTIEEAALRHGGEAEASKQAYAALSDDDRECVDAFLRSLCLYQTDKLPTDVNGDGRIDECFHVAGMDTGVERFNPEWLFRVPGRIEGPVVNVRGEKILSCALTNVKAAYGCDLPLLRDTDGDGFPDVIDPDPLTPGFKNGKD